MTSECDQNNEVLGKVHHHHLGNKIFERRRTQETARLEVKPSDQDYTVVEKADGPSFTSAVLQHFLVP